MDGHEKRTERTRDAESYASAMLWLVLIVLAGVGWAVYHTFFA